MWGADGHGNVLVLAGVDFTERGVELQQVLRDEARLILDDAVSVDSGIAFQLELTCISCQWIGGPVVYGGNMILRLPRRFSGICQLSFMSRIKVDLDSYRCVSRLRGFEALRARWSALRLTAPT